MKKLLSLGMGTLLCGVLFVACGGSSSSDSSNNEDDGYSVSGKLVDPYIVGAVLCQDTNGNGSCDSGEPTSTTTDSSGVFKFSESLTPGKKIITKTQGKHNGVEYGLSLSAIVADDGSIKVISPLTTLESKGLTKAQIRTILTDANITGLSDDDISSDPMEGMSGKTAVTDDELKKLQASLATYGLLKVMEGSSSLKELNASQIVASSEVGLIAKSMVSAIKSALNANTFTSVKGTIDTAKANAEGNVSGSGQYIPYVTSDVIIKTAVTVMDRVVEVGYTKCNETDGNVTLALQEVNSTLSSVGSMVSDISNYYYGLANKNTLANLPTAILNALPQKIKDGKDNGTGVLVLDENNNFAVLPRQKINNLYGFVNLNAGTLGDGNIEIARLNNSIQSIVITRGDNNSTANYNFSSNTVVVDSSDISDGKNTFTIKYSDREKYFYFYRGQYDSTTDSKSVNGNSNYIFSSIKADDVNATDMFISVDNYNDVNTTNDDKWIYLLPNSSNQVQALNLNASGGYRIDSMEYEQYIVANPNGDNAGQDINVSTSINVRKLTSSNSISGTLKKIDSNSNGSAVVFSSSDATTNNIWLHAHYTNANAQYNAVCNGSKCDNNSTGNVWVAAQDMHIENAKNHTSATYDFVTAEYSINRLALNSGYKLLAFWKNKNILGDEYNVSSSSGNDIVLQGLSRDVNGTLTTGDTRIRIARVVTFSGQPNILYSNIVDKNGSDGFSINYQYDSSGTSSYLLWGGSSSSLDFNSTHNPYEGNKCDDSTKCRPITINESLLDIDI